MAEKTKRFDAGAALERLRSGGGAVPWPERRAMARGLGQALAKGERAGAALDLTGVLASDSKWEVRKEVAELLIYLPEIEFLKLAAKLSEDDNAFVCNAAKRALARRQEGIPTRSQDLDAEIADLRQAHGEALANTVRKLADRMYDRLMGEVVHEMRGVITPLSSGVAALQKGLTAGRLDPKMARERLAVMEKRLSFLERLFDDMRAYSRALSPNRLPERLAEIATEAHVMTLERLHENAKAAKAVKVKLDVPPDLVVHAARHQLVVAFANLLKNAMEAVMGQRGGQVTLQAKRLQEKHVIIIVKDNGPGRCVEDLEEIRKFIPGRTTMKNRGTGFGLPIARRNVLAHGGSFDVDSPGGRGFAVTVVLPLHQEDSGKA